MIVIILLIVIAVLLVLLLTQRNRRTYRDPYRDTYYRTDMRNPYDPVPPDYPSPGFGAGSFLGGMAAGALLTYLLEQGRIDMGQFDYFNGLGEDQMIHELMQQNIIQQDEIDALQQRLNEGPIGGDGSPADDNYPNPDPSYANDVDYDIQDPYQDGIDTDSFDDGNYDDYNNL
ncbi:hypothetical protein [Alicyclobacillus acidoterrestris]|uniref:Uncharacterized protein n=1 Tax=Alicyclobacillus acidoterrestris (strain ATCC 49025 / DSM 3922 / CIP 106132 / NCIMB 13137 / GD3B) TaxID=1356854 RepID=T0BQB4_ALIAG|nr:hypothetical protein [Alicyclobacillus acidoterrestris]EPZ42730.1 hypothetical protein N007_14360 [Alicyclobacillus acidoterrestris ATCC 49025]UNO50113.1 hypothetical protein K1I37_06385 [Alicyclobacillus acidoterrestris]